MSEKSLNLYEVVEIKTGKVIQSGFSSKLEAKAARNTCPGYYRAVEEMKDIQDSLSYKWTSELRKKELKADLETVFQRHLEWKVSKGPDHPLRKSR